MAMQPLLWKCPPWHRLAKCAKEPDPRRWDCDGRLAPEERLMGAQHACLGCPVMAECARDALAEGSTGVVRAGIPLNAKITPTIRRALKLIAAGSNPHRVVADVLAIRMTTQRVAILRLAKVWNRWVA